LNTDYQTISKHNILAKLRPYFDNGQMFLRDDGKVDRNTRLTANGPWIHQKLAPNRNCLLYHTYYNTFGFVHSVCQECWKVVVRPKTLVQLKQLMDIQRMMDLPSKCGMEKRETVHGLYGGYFYNDSLEQGLQCYKAVRMNVDSMISPDVVVLLKKGCTEFEIDGKSPSDQWEISEDQKKMERLLADLVVDDTVKMPQPEHVKEDVWQSCVHWAYSNGDSTYAEFTGGKPLFPPYKTYHEVCDGEEKKEGQEDCAERPKQLVAVGQ